MWNKLCMCMWKKTEKNGINNRETSLLKVNYNQTKIKGRKLSAKYICIRSDHEFKRIIVVVQSLSHVWLFVTPWTAAHQVRLSLTISRSFFKLMSIDSDSIQPSHLLLSLLLLPSIFPSIRIFSNQSVFHIRWLQLQHQSFQWILRIDFL